MYCTLYKSIFECYILIYITKSNFSRIIKTSSTKCFYGEFLLDTKDTHSVRNIRSPSKDITRAEYEIVRVVELLILRRKALL